MKVAMGAGVSGIVTDRGAEVKGSVSSRGKRSFHTPQYCHWLWDTPRFLCNGYWRIFPEE